MSQPYAPKSIKDLGLIIRKTRKARGYSQEHLAGICGVGRRFIYEIEAGKETSEIGKVFQVLRRLGLDLTILDRAENA